MEPVKRAYRSPRREAQAARTRDAIVDATRRLLGAGGMAGTTMETIAAEAGVSVQTVYATYGSKAAVLIAVLDRLEADAAAEAPPAAAGRAEPRARLEEVVAFHRRLYERGADVIAVGLGSAATDRDLAAHVEAGHRRRRAALVPVVREWSRSGALREGLAAREAVDVLWSLTSPDLYLLHVRGNGWSPGRYASWLLATLQALVMSETCSARPTRGRKDA